MDTTLKLLDKWPAAGPKLLWTAPLLKSGGYPTGSTGLASPVVADGKVYVHECLWVERFHFSDMIHFASARASSFNSSGLGIAGGKPSG